MKPAATILALAITILAAVPGAALAAVCGVDGAAYVLRGSPGFTATLRRQPGARSAHELIFEVRSAATGRTFSFTINRGAGYGEATLASMKGDIAGSVELYALDEAEVFIDYFGDAEGPAPKRLLAPKLGPALWYQAARLAGDPGAEGERMPRAFFDRTSCGRPPS